MERPEVTESIFDEPPGGTDLSEEEKLDLIPSYISTRAELNQAEQSNIATAQLWSLEKKRNPLDVLFLRRLHKRMFKDVWKWAGKFRLTERNIGIDPIQIAVEVKKLVDDAQYQMDHQSYSQDEIAARFHHRLVLIHPFPNGNGRHGRMATDILLDYMDRDRFTWGAGDLETPGEVRDRYIAALKAADKQDYLPLITFVRSGTQAQ